MLNIYIHHIYTTYLYLYTYDFKIYCVFCWGGLESLRSLRRPGQAVHGALHAAPLPRDRGRALSSRAARQGCRIEGLGGGPLSSGVAETRACV